MAKVIEFYIRDLFPRTARRTGSAQGEVIEFSALLKQPPSICAREILSIESLKRTQEASIEGIAANTENTP